MKLPAMEEEPRQIIQIIPVDAHTLWALCIDGSIWQTSWRVLPRYWEPVSEFHWGQRPGPPHLV